MTTEELGKRLLDHAKFMITSGQFRGTLAEYLGFHRGRGAAWEEARRLAEEEAQTDALRDAGDRDD